MKICILMFIFLCGGQKIKNIGSALWFCQYLVFCPFTMVYFSIYVCRFCLFTLAANFLVFPHRFQSKDKQSFQNRALQSRSFFMYVKIKNQLSML